MRFCCVACTLTILLGVAAPLQAQKHTKPPRYSIDIRTAAGTSFPTIEGANWQATFYGAGAFSAGISKRFSPRWGANSELGMAAYALDHRGPSDHYILDFASPYLPIGAAHFLPVLIKQQGFCKLMAGMQLGYANALTETFADYSVSIKSSDKLYAFVRPEMGMTGALQTRKKSGIRNVRYSLSVFYRHNLHRLGTAIISSSSGLTVLSPRGSVLGVAFTLLLPAGKATVKASGSSPSKNRNEPSKHH